MAGERRRQTDRSLPVSDLIVATLEQERIERERGRPWTWWRDVLPDNNYWRVLKAAAIYRAKAAAKNE